jgi:hypothetical protein
MRRSTFVLPLVALTAVLAGVSANPTAAAADHKLPPKCPRAHAKLIRSDRRAVVYEAPRPPEEREPEFFLIFACAHGHRSYALGRKAAFGPEGGGGISSETLAGPMVAYEKSQVAFGHDSFVILVRDLLTGRIIHEAPTAEAEFPGDVGKDMAEKIVLKRDGAVAWIVQTEANEYQIHAVDKTGNRLLAASAYIVPRSLMLKGSTLRWIQGGKPMSAVLN